MRKIYILSLLYIMSAVAVSAQQKEYKGEMGVTPMQFEQRGDSLLISIDFDISGVHVDSRRSISLIPTLVAPGVERALPEVMVKGRANYLTSKRELALMSRAERRLYEQKPPYAVVKGYKADERKQISYRQTILFEPWMKEAGLDIREDLCGCGNAPRSLAMSQLVGRVTLEPILLPYEVSPYLSYVQPMVEAVKKREMESEAFLDFVVSKIDIRPDYMNNPRELKKITDMVEEVRNDPAVRVKSISVVGYASPEGTLPFNKYLSEGRAKALVDYLLPRFDYPKSLYRIAFGGENWAGLRAMLDTTHMRGKEEILTVLNDGTISDEVRKQRFKWRLNGEPYRYMLKEFYPSLRKAICKVEYIVKGFDIEEAREVFKTNPKNLSLNEMFLVANTYENGSQEFVDVFETAVRIFPEDRTANLNAAAAALSRKDTAMGEKYLNKISDADSVPEYHNAMGVLLMLKGEYAQAEKHLHTAAKAGLESARRNLQEMRKKLENIKQINN